MEDLISVIVPIYKVECYLKSCVQSIRNQTYKNIEIILVDDGSPDECGTICDQLKKEDSRIQVIHKANGGLSDARNAGMKVAKGKYVCFVDSDDYIQPQMIEQLHFMAVKEQAQIAVCGFKYVTQKQKAKTEKRLLSQEEEWEILNGKEAQYRYFNKEDRILYTVAWNKLYESELFSDIQYPKGKIHEDEFTTYRLLYEAERIVVCRDDLYCYLMRENSIMGQFNKKRFHLLEAYRERMKFYAEHNEKELFGKMIPLYMRMTAQYVDWLKRDDMGNRQILINQKREFGKIYRENKKRMQVSWSIKMESFLFLHWFEGYIRLWKFVKH